MTDNEWRAFADGQDAGVDWASRDQSTGEAMSGQVQHSDGSRDSWREALRLQGRRRRRWHRRGNIVLVVGVVVVVLAAVLFLGIAIGQSAL